MQNRLRVLALLVVVLSALLFVGCGTDYTFPVWDSPPSVEKAPYRLEMPTGYSGYYITGYTIEDGVISALALRRDGTTMRVVIPEGKWVRVIGR